MHTVIYKLGMIVAYNDTGSFGMRPSYFPDNNAVLSACNLH